QAVTLQELQALVDSVTRYYRSRGYFVALAYLPEQEIRDGRALISVIEGRYGSLEVVGDVLRPEVTARYLAVLRSSGAVRLQDRGVEGTTLLLADLPGVDARAALRAGSEVGTTDVVFTIEPERRLSARLSADNHGNAFTGVVRAGIQAQLDNATGR